MLDSNLRNNGFQLAVVACRHVMRLELLKKGLESRKVFVINSLVEFTFWFGEHSQMTQVKQDRKNQS